MVLLLDLLARGFYGLLFGGAGVIAGLLMWDAIGKKHWFSASVRLFMLFWAVVFSTMCFVSKTDVRLRREGLLVQCPTCGQEARVDKLKQPQK